jgi:hypothetical protein
MAIFWTSCFLGPGLRQISSILLIPFAIACLLLSMAGSASAGQPPVKTGTSTESTTHEAAVGKHAGSVGSQTGGLGKHGPETGKQTSAADKQTGAAGKKSSNKATPSSNRTSPEKAEPGASGKEKAAPATSGKGSQKEPATTPKRAPSGRLVPPPPPSVPMSGEMGMPGMGTTMTFVGENIEYMSVSDLRELKDKTDREIERWRKQVEDLIASADEKQQRSNSFEQLYTEGVISRRELEASKRESEKAGQDLAEAKQALTLAEQKHARIELRLATLAKQKKPIVNSSVSKQHHHK